MPRLRTQQPNLPLRLVYIRNINIPPHATIPNDLVPIIRARCGNSKQFVRQLSAGRDARIQLPPPSGYGIIVARQQSRVVGVYDMVSEERGGGWGVGDVPATIWKMFRSE